LIRARTFAPDREIGRRGIAPGLSGVEMMLWRDGATGEIDGE
jgi:hypothetical protein